MLKQNIYSNQPKNKVKYWIRIIKRDRFIICSRYYRFSIDLIIQEASRHLTKEQLDKLERSKKY